MIRKPCVLLAVLLLAACRGSSPTGPGPTPTPTPTPTPAPTPTPTPPPAQIAGTWDATFTDMNGGTGPFLLVLTQTGPSVTGTFANPVSGASGSFAGTVSGSTLLFQMSQATPCPGSFTGTATITPGGNQMAGTWAGPNCTGSLSGTLTAMRR